MQTSTGPFAGRPTPGEESCTAYLRRHSPLGLRQPLGRLSGSPAAMSPACPAVARGWRQFDDCLRGPLSNPLSCEKDPRVARVGRIDRCHLGRINWLRCVGSTEASIRSLESWETWDSTQQETEVRGSMSRGARVASKWPGMARRTAAASAAASLPERVVSAMSTRARGR
jgi:hypothetical protein